MVEQGIMLLGVVAFVIMVEIVENQLVLQHGIVSIFFM
jgi:hypothetical protein